MWNKIQKNWKSALTVSIVNIPLSIALAIASGATPAQGIITAFWSGLFAGLLGSSNYNIVGPTGALAGILIAFTIKNGYQFLPIIAILSGVFIGIAYIFRLGEFIIFIPQSVVHGFTLGVAFIIGLGQLDNALGITGLQKSESIVKNLILIINNLDKANWYIFIIFIFLCLFIIIWNKTIKKIPGAAVVAFLGILVVYITKKFGFNLNLITLEDKYPSIDVHLLQPFLTQIKWEYFFRRDVWIISVTTAIIAILETLLSGQIADSMTKTKFDRRKEVFGLSIANLISGIFGGIPATAALARTALNIKSGATHKLSSIINAILVGIISIFFFNYFKLLPLVCIASILFIVAINMIETKHFIRLVYNEKVAFLLSLMVSLVVLFEDPIIGLLVGSIIALLIFINKVAYGDAEIVFWKNGKVIATLYKDEFLKNQHLDSDMVIYRISGTLTYINMPAHLKTIQKIKNNNYVIISLRHAFYADIDGIDYLIEIIENLKRNNNKTIILTGINKEVEKKIKSEYFYEKKLKENKIYKSTSDAIQSIQEGKI